MKNVPCRYCETRSLGCRGRCEKYIEYKREREAILSKRHAEKENNRALDAIEIGLTARARRRKH